VAVAGRQRLGVGERSHAGLPIAAKHACGGKKWLNWFRFFNASPQFARGFPPIKARANKIFKIIEAND